MIHQWGERQHQRFGVAVTGGTTGIREMSHEGLQTSEPVYNLYGQRLSQPQRGLNIVRGRKFLLK